MNPKNIWKMLKGNKFLLPPNWTNSFLIVGLTFAAALFFLSLANLLFWNGNLTNTLTPEFKYSDFRSLLARSMFFF